MKFVSKAKKFLGDAQTRKAYLLWLLHRVCFTEGPFVKIAGKSNMGGWKKFSEFLTLRDLISDAELAFMRRLTADDEHRCFIDIGANIGTFALFFATEASGCVHVFEPVPETFVRLVKNVQRNSLQGSMVCNCLAVSDRNDVVTLRVQSDSPATNRIVGMENEAPSEEVSFQCVGSVSLDNYCSEAKLEFCDFVKIDVEGHEPMVLRGAQRLYREGRIGVTLLEVCPKNLEEVGFFVEDLYNEIKNCSCNAFRLNEDGSVGDRLGLDDLKSIILENVVLLPEGSP